MNTRELVKLDFAVFPDYGLPRDEWLGWRRQGIGSSDVPKIVGLDRFGTEASLYYDKIGERPDEPENEMMGWGRKLEGVVATEFADRNPDIFAVAQPPAMYQHAELDFPLASPDRLLAVTHLPGEYEAILEIKTGRNSDIWEDGPPPAYVVQVQHQLEVCGLDHASIAVLLNGRDYREFEVERDPLLCEILMEKEAEFWALVQARTPPEVDGHPATTETLKRVFGSTRPGAVVELSDEQADAIARYKETKARLTVVTENHDEAANVLRAALGDAEIGTRDGEIVVTWKKSTGGKGRVDLKELEKELPEIVALYRKPSTSRTLLVK